MKNGKIILSRKSRQISTPWFESKKGFRVKLTNRVTETITCDKNDYEKLNEDEIKELMQLGLIKK